MLRTFPRYQSPSSSQDQRRIAKIIGQASRLRAGRRQAITLLDDLAQSIFLDMFGDPVSNMHRWPVAILGDSLSANHQREKPNMPRPVRW